ncbi:MAG: putative hydrolases or acyltransferases (alpha/beta hydrolase superfamily) [Saliniramus fredricksonii]|uniref:Pimeloyl-ACP methyl ester carboxylesterase n=1 Tax=Saliniramus fredricksonii TaxID=1653334 RepID=A0A0P7ZZW7_9HYPH|nr:alpha/beta hydrolase [Saliniramus fredricksonii]KPQ10609.1 MAG: putative hydrolases or acyltransferases (alpha/beta hydrolase superfamily) [Saliniramus fredricksonii]SCC79305.1 Pimeloyl-ACP methyl ester carboxylesterase [Saliniramus fredricksonii]
MQEDNVAAADMANGRDDAGYRSRFVSAADGLVLHLRDYGPIDSALTPVVCLPGIARTAYDFHDLARALSGAETPRRVLALDYRGRGLSQHDRNWRNYDIGIEMDDCLAAMTAMGVHQANFVGTSRGGLVTMAIAAARPTAIRAAVFNDIGPVIEPKGLMRIRGYVGKLPVPRDFTQAVEIMQTISDKQFPGLDDEGWMKLARGTWQEKDGKLVPVYDPALLKGLAGLDLEKPLPPLWTLFAALSHAPLLVLRGAHSDILSNETLREMEKRHPACETHSVPGQGHAPLLDGEAAARIVDFIAGVETGASTSQPDTKPPATGPEPSMPRADGFVSGGGAHEEQSTIKD